MEKLMYIVLKQIIKYTKAQWTTISTVYDLII